MFWVKYSGYWPQIIYKAFGGYFSAKPGNQFCRIIKATRNMWKTDFDNDNSKNEKQVLMWFSFFNHQYQSIVRIVRMSEDCDDGHRCYSSSCGWLRNHAPVIYIYISALSIFIPWFLGFQPSFWCRISPPSHVFCFLSLLLSGRSKGWQQGWAFLGKADLKGWSSSVPWIFGEDGWFT